MHTILFWKRVDLAGIERLELSKQASGFEAKSTIICVEDEGFRLDYYCRLSPTWRVEQLEVERISGLGRKSLHLARRGPGWVVDGDERPDLVGAQEPDLSVTPFCNTLALRRLEPERDVTEIEVCFIDGRNLSVQRSRQRYERLARDRYRYVDLGLYKGFEATLTVDERCLVRTYEGLFEMIEIAK